MTESTMKYLTFVITVTLCTNISYALPENCTVPCSLTNWYAWNCTSCYHGGNRAFRQRGVCCFGITDSVICLKVCKIGQSRVLEEDSCPNHCGISTTTLSPTSSKGMSTTASTSGTTAMISSTTTTKNLTSTRQSTSLAMPTRGTSLRIFTSSTRAGTSSTVSTKALTTVIASTSHTSTLSSRSTSRSVDTSLTFANTVSPGSPSTTSLPSSLCASSTCTSTTTELTSTVGSTVPTRISLVATNVSTNRETTENTGYGTKANSSVCLALCRRSEDWTKCLQDCLYDNEKNKSCAILCVCIFMVGLIVGVLLMLILLYCLKRKTDKKNEDTECVKSGVNGHNATGSTPTDKQYKKQPIKSNNGSTEFRNGYHNKKRFKTSMIYSAKIYDKNNLTSEANRAKQYGHHNGTVHDHVTHSKLTNSVLRSNANMHYNFMSSLSSFNRTRRLYDKKSDTSNKGSQSEMNRIRTQDKDDGATPRPFDFTGLKRLVGKEGDGATSRWLRNKMVTPRPTGGTTTDAEDYVRVMNVNPNSALGILKTPPSN